MVCTLSKSAAIFEVCKNDIISRSLAHVARAQEANTVHCSPVCNSDLLIPVGHVCAIDDVISLVKKPPTPLTNSFSKGTNWWSSTLHKIWWIFFWFVRDRCVLFGNAILTDIDCISKRLAIWLCSSDQNYRWQLLEVSRTVIYTTSLGIRKEFLKLCTKQKKK